MTFGVCMYSLAGLLIVVLLFGFVYKCQLCSHGDACGVSGNCVCRHLMSASFLRAVEGGHLVKVQNIISCYVKRYHTIIYQADID